MHSALGAARLLQVVGFPYRGCSFTAVTRGRDFDRSKGRRRERASLRVRACRKSKLLGALGCVKTVSNPLQFKAQEICLSEEQTPQVIVFSRSR
jgi:hypothetical protein